MFVRPRSARQDFGLSLVTGVAVGAVGRGIAIVAGLLGASYALAHLLDDVLTGVIAGIAMFISLRALARRRAADIKRLRDIGEMNHHVRNALQVIQLSHFAADDGERVRMIAEASERIEYALKEFNV